MPALQTPRTEEFLTLLRNRLPDKTMKHCVSVAEHMLSYADDAGITQEQAVTAGLLHDLCKPMKHDELIATARRYGIRDHLDTPTLLHGPVAAHQCREKLGITDEEVCDAIYWHTTGRADWNAVGLALYLADFSEPLRAIAQAAQARRLLIADGFESALGYTVAAKVQYVREHYAPDAATEAFAQWVSERSQTQ